MNTGMTKKKKKGKERSQQNLYRPKSVPKKTVPRKPKPTPAQLNDPEFSDDDTDYGVVNDDEGRLIVFPKRSVVLSTLPVAVREELQKNRIVSNHEDLANICLSRERSALVNGKECFTLTDSNGRIHLFWIPSKVSSKSVFRNGNMNAAGYIRDQFDHPLCWDFSFCDLLSATCVLYGHMQRYEPLSQIYVCQHVDRSNYKKKKVVTDHDTKQKKCHSCYEDSMYNALKYLTNSKGIPKAEKREIGEFDCNQERSLKRGEELFGKIKNVYRYKQLKDALKRLRTHPVTATLICFDGWQNPGIYKGPYSGPQPPYYMGEHQVVMLDCVKHEGTVVIRCKSSNGVDTGNDGYLFIDPEIRFMEVAGARKKGGGFSCKKYPQSLLYDFYSVDMEKGKYPITIEETESLKIWNSKFKIDFSVGRGQTSGMQGSSSTNLPSISPYSGESASQPTGNNPAVDLINRNQVNNEEGQSRHRVLAIAACNGESASQPAGMQGSSSTNLPSISPYSGESASQPTGNNPAVDLINRNQVNNEEGQSRHRVLVIAACNGESASQPAGMQGSSSTNLPSISPYSGESASQPTGNNPAVDLINRNQVNNEEGQSRHRVLVIAACNGESASQPAGMQGSSSTNLPSISPYSGESASQPTGNNPAVDLINRNQVNNEEGQSRHRVLAIAACNGESASQPAGMQGSSSTNLPSISPYSGESASQPTGNNPAVDLINRNQVNNEEGQSRHRVLAIAACNGESASQPAGDIDAAEH